MGFGGYRSRKGTELFPPPGTQGQVKVVVRGVDPNTLGGRIAIEQAMPAAQSYYGKCAHNYALSVINYQQTHATLPDGGIVTTSFNNHHTRVMLDLRGVEEVIFEELNESKISGIVGLPFSSWHAERKAEREEELEGATVTSYVLLEYKGAELSLLTPDEIGPQLIERPAGEQYWTAGGARTVSWLQGFLFYAGAKIFDIATHESNDEVLGACVLASGVLVIYSRSGYSTLNVYHTRVLELNLEGTDTAAAVNLESLTRVFSAPYHVRRSTIGPTISGFALNGAHSNTTMSPQGTGMAHVNLDTVVELQVVLSEEAELSVIVGKSDQPDPPEEDIVWAPATTPDTAHGLWSVTDTFAEEEFFSQQPGGPRLQYTLSTGGYRGSASLGYEHEYRYGTYWEGETPKAIGVEISRSFSVEYTQDMDGRRPNTTYEPDRSYYANYEFTLNYVQDDTTTLTGLPEGDVEVYSRQVDVTRTFQTEYNRDSADYNNLAEGDAYWTYNKRLISSGTDIVNWKEIILHAADGKLSVCREQEHNEGIDEGTIEQPYVRIKGAPDDDGWPGDDGTNIKRYAPLWSLHERPRVDNDPDTNIIYRYTMIELGYDYSDGNYYPLELFKGPYNSEYNMYLDGTMVRSVEDSQNLRQSWSMTGQYIGMDSFWLWTTDVKLVSYHDENGYLQDQLLYWNPVHEDHEDLDPADARVQGEGPRDGVKFMRWSGKQLDGWWVMRSATYVSSPVLVGDPQAPTRCGTAWTVEGARVMYLSIPQHEDGILHYYPQAPEYELHVVGSGDAEGVLHLSTDDDLRDLSVI